MPLSQSENGMLRDFGAAYLEALITEDWLPVAGFVFDDYYQNWTHQITSGQELHVVFLAANRRPSVYVHGGPDSTAAIGNVRTRADLLCLMKLVGIDVDLSRFPLGVKSNAAISE